MSDLYNTLAWEAVRAAVLARDGNRCTVARLLGGKCDGALHVHHLKSASDYPELALDVDNLGTACASHHPKWEAVRRAVMKVRGWKTCKHYHPTVDGRRSCERKLNAALD